MQRYIFSQLVGLKLRTIPFSPSPAFSRCLLHKYNKDRHMSVKQYSTEPPSDNLPPKGRDASYKGSVSWWVYNTADICLSFRSYFLIICLHLLSLLSAAFYQSDIWLIGAEHHGWPTFFLDFSYLSWSIWFSTIFIAGLKFY